MQKYINFKTDDNNNILIEVDEKENPAGVTKAGLRDIPGKVILEAQTLFENAIKQALRINIETFYVAIKELPHPPTDVEINFGLKATGELGNIAISKIGAEANYSIKLTWKQPFQD